MSTGSPSPSAPTVTRSASRPARSATSAAIRRSSRSRSPAPAPCTRTRSCGTLSYRPWPGSVPYVIAVLEFDDAPGIRMIANIVESDVDAVRVGSRVQLAWDDIDDEVTVPRFRLAAG
ncbi:Zn-ribbon domain-containing OB-fold protein [Actinomadura madurae]|uniref:Zn-ribbon domain-containing OB-fold protein n=1 Tax=Actinomadura madurae TaxID=1993 RepID=UPI0027E2CFAD|nr:OB-fold domain-containing protein [Actinomadura madurae]